MLLIGASILIFRSVWTFLDSIAWASRGVGLAVLLVVPNAELLVLELLKDSAPDRARAMFDHVKQRLLDYDNFALSAPQRRFLMREA